MTIGYLAIANWKHSDGNFGAMTVAFEATEDAAEKAGQKIVDDNTLSENTSEFTGISVHHVREISHHDRWSFADDDIVWTGGDGNYVKADAIPTE